VTGGTEHSALFLWSETAFRRRSRREICAARVTVSASEPYHDRRSRARQRRAQSEHAPDHVRRVSVQR
jgi:hypothetical protein